MRLSWLHFWGWQLIIVAAAITLPLGITTSKEYAELEWPIDIAITLIWVVFGINMFGTILKRRERHLYVAIWFYIATWVTVAMLHIVNSIELPVSLSKSYSWYAGVQDALVQWWYGHNAVAFFLTTPYLGLMYYFLPKAANRPVYSYKLSIIHFWALIFIYIWAGPHHLLYSSSARLGAVARHGVQHHAHRTELGRYAQRPAHPAWCLGPCARRSRAEVLRGGRHRYGMSTLEGPLLSIKFLNAISHFTDWTIAHVHVGGLGWNGFMTFGMVYWLVPRMFGTKLYSARARQRALLDRHAGHRVLRHPPLLRRLHQSLMWKQFTPDGYLVYPNFLDTLLEIKYRLLVARTRRYCST